MSYSIQASGDSLMRAAVCASETITPQITGWRQMTQRSRARTNRPNAIPPPTYSTMNASEPATPMAVLTERICS